MSDDDEENALEENSLIFDNGTASMKAGFAGDDTPRSVFPTITATKLVEDVKSTHPKRKKLVGDEAVEYKYAPDVTVKYPIENGEIESWDHMELVWRHAYNELRVVPQEHRILATEPALNSKAKREKMCQIFMETFNAPFYYVGVAPVLSLYASGRTTGLVIDFGHQHTQFVPIYEGYNLPHAVRKYGTGGYHMTKHLQKSLLNKGYDVSWETASAIKEQHLYLTENGIENELKKPLCNRPNWLVGAYLRSIEGNYSEYTSMEIEKFCDEYCGAKNEFIRTTQQYKLPDGRVIELNEEQFTSAEILFNPALIEDAHTETDPIQDAFHSVINKVDNDIKGDIWANVVLSGGTSKIPRLEKRLESSVKALGGWSRHLHLVVPPERKYSVWIGGSILASLSTFEQMWLTHDEYDSAGPGIIHRKCF